MACDAAWQMRAPVPSQYLHSPPLFDAASKGDVRRLAVLLRGTEYLKLESRFDGETCLLHAASRDQLDAVKVLVQAGADVTARGPGGRTVLHVAAANSLLELLHFLLQHCASDLVDLADSDGLTPLDHAQTSLDRGLEALGQLHPARPITAGQAVKLHHRLQTVRALEGCAAWRQRRRDEAVVAALEARLSAMEARLAKVETPQRF